MAAHYDSKHGIVRLAPEALYMNFVDMRNFSKTIPEKLQASITADFDNLKASVQGFTIGVRIDERKPYSLVRFVSTESPFAFEAKLHFDPETLPGQTDFHLEVDADLNFMMKTMLGGKIQGAIDKAVDTLVALSNGEKIEMPDGLA